MSGYEGSRKPVNSWHAGSTANNRKTTNHKAPKLSNSETKFKEAQKKLQAAVQKYAKEYESSEEEEELDTNIIGSILKNYTQTGGKNENLGRTQAFLEDVISSNTSSCLICISTVKRNDFIWNCSECYSSFHLMCIQRWSKDTITQQKQALEAQIQVRHIVKIAWGCPKCRHEYGLSDIPTNYECFCKKTINPVYQALLAPHSCGETCGKDLKPYCGHMCMLLCHPGPCPSCPKTVNVTCYCGLQPPKPQRCSNKEWSCGSPCTKLLICGKHKCAQPCHAGECQPCPKKSIQKCVCGASQKLRDCMTPLWQCIKVCDKHLECGNHNCLEICHIGECDPCIFSKPRFCPCGKSSFHLPCTEETPTCGDTCGKLLECGVHICHQRCHKDKCGTCLETITKSCRCGLHTKEVQCKKPFLCESKCKQIKDCNKHPCNRKCCDGNCSPCEKPCARTLSCGNHKCNSICHRGPCYPCNQTENVLCRCGFTNIAAPCGRKNKTRPPKCNQMCMLPPECHHITRENHTCHFGDCPPCKQICNKPHSNCSHFCPVSCHSAVLVTIKAQKASMPWEQTGPQTEQKSLPCPNCVVPVTVTCLGGHETCEWPCYLAKPSSCHRPCGRLLSCENHSCTFACHTVEGATDICKSGTNCEKCESGCVKQRPEGCPHKCPNVCHPGPCPPCKQMVRIRCHCGLNQPYVTCNDWSSGQNTETLQSCGNQCPKNFECGHRCRSNCHSGVCPDSKLCKKRVKVTCTCKRIKKEFSCETVQNKMAVVECDEICLQKKEEDQKLKDLENEQKRKEEELKQMKDLEQFEKKFQGKKRTKERRTYNVVEEKSLLKKLWFIIPPVSIVLISIYIYFL